MNNSSQPAGVAIEFQHVTFTHPGTDQRILNDISFTIQSGDTAALVGLNGSGKMAICKLLLRFYEPTSGTILINGIDIRNYSRESIYDHFSALFQDFVKYERSIAENVSFGKGVPFNGHDSQTVLSNLEMVGLDTLAQELPHQLSTILGRRFEGGQQLSIGQWQRLATARALYKNHNYEC